MTQAEWMESQFTAGRKYLREDDPFWRDHWLADLIRESFARKEDVPIGVLLVSNRPLTEKEVKRGREIYEALKEKR